MNARRSEARAGTGNGSRASSTPLPAIRDDRDETSPTPCRLLQRTSPALQAKATRRPRRGEWLVSRRARLGCVARRSNSASHLRGIRAMTCSFVNARTSASGSRVRATARRSLSVSCFCLCCRRSINPTAIATGHMHEHNARQCSKTYHRGEQYGHGDEQPTSQCSPS